MFQSILVECAKLRRSLALLLCAAAPTMVALLAMVILLDRKDPLDWSMFSTSTAAIWAFFMLPMTVTALTILMAQLEHGARSWNHLLALPVGRWRHHAAKAVVVVLLVAAMNLALWLMIPLAGMAVEALEPGRLVGAFDWLESLSLLGRMLASALLLIGLQLWVALRFRSFVPPLVLGIGGTFVAVVATGAKQGLWFPWLMPTNMLAADPARAQLGLAIGLGGGLVVLLAMVLDLARKEYA
ncbi:MAG TPA: ABC transporter permease [Allosphingosinicella sp.]|nr:ABC transporter permease [Allosphingosinicella sp.]